MDISSIFKQLHGILDVEALVPMVNRRDLIKKDTFDAAVKYLEIDAKNVYFDPNNQMNWCVYYDGLVYFSLYNMTIELLQSIQVKEMLHQQIQYLHKLKSEKKFANLFKMIDKKILIPSFIEFYKEIPTNQIYNIFIDLYQRTEYGFDKIPKEVIQYAFQYREMSQEWQKRMEALSKKVKGKEFVKIFRGETPKSTPNNMSWTLSKKVATFFSTRFNSHGNILQKTVPLDKCLDYLTSRNEEEILYLPS